MTILFSDSFPNAGPLHDSVPEVVYSPSTPAMESQYLWRSSSGLTITDGGVRYPAASSPDDTQGAWMLHPGPQQSDFSISFQFTTGGSVAPYVEGRHVIGFSVAFWDVGPRGYQGGSVYARAFVYGEPDSPVKAEVSSEWVVSETDAELRPTAFGANAFLPNTTYLGVFDVRSTPSGAGMDPTITVSLTLNGETIGLSGVSQTTEHDYGNGPEITNYVRAPVMTHMYIGEGTTVDWVVAQFEDIVQIDGPVPPKPPTAGFWRDVTNCQQSTSN